MFLGNSREKYILYLLCLSQILERGILLLQNFEDYCHLFADISKKIYVNY